VGENCIQEGERPAVQLLRRSLRGASVTDLAAETGIPEDRIRARLRAATQFWMDSILHPNGLAYHSNGRERAAAASSSDM
jgi:hypothetical protein